MDQSTVKLICDDANLQVLLKKFNDAGGHVPACKKCSENLGCLEQIKKLEGVDEVFYVGESFTKILKDEEKLITV